MKIKAHTRRLRLESLFGGLLLVAAGASLAFAQNMDSPADRTAPSHSTPATTSRDAVVKSDNDLARGDRRFFKQAAHLGEQEVVISKIASDRAIHPQVKSFAAEMVRAHDTANEELATLARRRGALLQPKDRVEVREIERKWNAKKGDDFDKDYLSAIIDAHQDTIDVLENGADSKDPEIVAYSNKMLPVVKGHLAHAESLEDTLK